MHVNNMLTRLNFIKEESNTVGILVIGNELLSKEFREAIQECYKKKSNNYKLYLVACANIKEVLSHTDYLHIDYVIFLLDTRLKSYATDVEFNIERMDKSFLCGRTCAVNATPHLPLSSTNKCSAVLALKEKYGVPILNGDVMNPTACSNLAQRILILAEASIGIKLKYPFIPWLFQMERNN